MENTITADNPVSENKARLMEMLSKCTDEHRVNYLADVMELQQMLDNAEKRSA